MRGCAASAAARHRVAACAPGCAIVFPGESFPLHDFAFCVCHLSATPHEKVPKLFRSKLRSTNMTRMNPLRVLSPILLRSASLLLLATSAYPQDAQRLVDQYVKAAGGSKALSKAQTIALEGTFNTADGKSGTYTLNTKLPNRYYS